MKKLFSLFLASWLLALTASGANFTPVGRVFLPASVAVGGVPFPRLGLQSISGSAASPSGGQCFPTGAAGVNDSLVAQFGWDLLGGNLDNWASTCTSRTRFAVVAAIKGFTKTGLHAVTPLVFQYEDFNETPLFTNIWFQAWETAVNCNNWWTYVTNASGTKGVSSFSASLNIIDMAHVVGTDGAGCTNTGLFPYALAAKLTYERYITLGTGNVSTANNLDGIYSDNMNVKALAAANYDWLRNGTQQNTTSSAGSTTAVNATIIGKTDFATWWAANVIGYQDAINSSAAAEIVPAGNGGDGMTPGLGFNNLSGLYPYPMEQFMWGSFNTPNSACGSSSALSFAGFANTVVWYQTMTAYSKAGSVPLLTGCVNPGAGGSGLSGSDAQLVRYSLALTLVAGNGYAFYGTNTDTVDYNVTTAIPQFDEFWGGNRNTAGYLGNALANSQGAVQTAATQNNIWRRDFDNGIVLVNGSATGINGSGCIGGSSGTITLGGTFFKLNGTNAVNSGGAGVTSVTLSPCDALILTRTGPN